MKERKRELGVKEVWMVGRHHLEAKGERVGECITSLKCKYPEPSGLLRPFNICVSNVNNSTRLQSSNLGVYMFKKEARGCS